MPLKGFSGTKTIKTVRPKQEIFPAGAILHEITGFENAVVVLVRTFILSWPTDIDQLL